MTDHDDIDRDPHSGGPMRFHRTDPTGRLTPISVDDEVSDVEFEWAMYSASVFIIVIAALATWWLA